MRYLLVLFAVLSISCSDNLSSNQFIGKWMRVEPNNPNFKPSNRIQNLLIISKNGNNFIVSLKNKKYVATYDKKNDKLKMKDGQYLVDIVYISDSKTILANGVEYQKTKCWSEETANGGVDVNCEG